MKIIAAMLLIAAMFLVAFTPVPGILPGSTNDAKLQESAQDGTNAGFIQEKRYPFGTPFPLIKGQEIQPPFDPKEPINSRTIENSKENNPEK